MARITRFNPPPNWPAPPAGWAPPADWRPDPAWGPAPEGWQLWVRERANPRGWIYALASGIGMYVVLLLVVLVASRGGLGAQAAGEMLFPFLMGGVVTGLISRASRTRWAIWVYPLVVLGMAFLLRAISLAGQVGARS